jgi:peptidoglycan/LPS O-acetylase OafA/YrhL
MMTPSPEILAPSEPTRFQFHYLPELDGFRGVAILLVIAGHVLDRNFGISNDLGPLGVLLFFVLSGFLITGLLEREQQQTGAISLTAFYRRRVLRIFPALTFYLIVLFVLMITHFVTDVPWYAFAACVLFVRNIWGRGAATGHLWSLSLEEQFYAIWPWTMKKFGAAAALRIAFGGAIAVTLFRMLCIQQHWLAHGFEGTYLYRPWFRFDSVLVGCAIALSLSRYRDSHSWTKYLGSRTVAAVGWPILFAWTIYQTSLWRVGYLTVQTFLAALLLWNLVISRGMVVRSIFSQPWLRGIGRVSYSWYMWQQMFTQSINPSVSWLQSFPMDVFASFAVGLLSYTFIEKPFLRIKSRMHKMPAIGSRT